MTNGSKSMTHETKYLSKYVFFSCLSGFSVENRTCSKITRPWYETSDFHYYYHSKYTYEYKFPVVAVCRRELIIACEHDV